MSLLLPPGLGREIFFSTLCFPYRHPIFSVSEEPFPAPGTLPSSPPTPGSSVQLCSPKPASLPALGLRVPEADPPPPRDHTLPAANSLATVAAVRASHTLCGTPGDPVPANKECPCAHLCACLVCQCPSVSYTCMCTIAPNSLGSHLMSWVGSFSPRLDEQKEAAS